MTRKGCTMSLNWQERKVGKPSYRGTWEVMVLPWYEEIGFPKACSVNVVRLGSKTSLYTPRFTNLHILGGGAVIPHLFTRVNKGYQFRSSEHLLFNEWRPPRHQRVFLCGQPRLPMSWKWRRNEFVCFVKVSVVLPSSFIQSKLWLFFTHDPWCLLLTFFWTLYKLYLPMHSGESGWRSIMNLPHTWQSLGFSMRWFHVSIIHVMVIFFCWASERCCSFSHTRGYNCSAKRWCYSGATSGAGLVIIS